jgi:hypothetical protein
MRTVAEWVTAVQASGMAMYFVAATVCGVAWWRARRDRRIARLAVILGILHAAFFFDVAFHWRGTLYDLLRAEAIANEWYDLRRGPQDGMLVLLAALLLTAIGFARRRYRSTPGAVLAIAGALLSIGCWSVEVISLHATDTVLYHHIGPLPIADFVWALACLMTVIGIWKASGQSGSH